MLANRVLTYAESYVVSIKRQLTEQDREAISFNQHTIAFTEQIDKIHYLALIQFEYYLQNCYIARTLTKIPNFFDDQPSFNRWNEFEQELYKQDQKMFKISQEAFNEFMFDSGVSLHVDLGSELNIRLTLLLENKSKKSWLGSLWRAAFPANFQLVKERFIMEGQVRINPLFKIAGMDTIESHEVVKRVAHTSISPNLVLWNKKNIKALEKLGGMYKNFNGEKALDAIYELPSEYRELAAQRINFITSPHLDKKQEKVILHDY